jgi:anti-sigma regulatory factor (Ser/Thr protein kinase)
MHVHFPNSAFLGNIEAFLGKLDFDETEKLKISFNPNWVSVHPVVLSAVAAIAEECKIRGVPIIATEQVAPKSLPYFIRMGLFNSLGLDPQKDIMSHEGSGRFVPLRKITSSAELGNFITDMIPLLHAKPENADPIKYVVSELIRNALEHACSPVGAFICAQYFKNTNRISIGVADRGIGIMSSIRVSHKANDDREAINLALKPGITGTTSRIGGTEYNAGAGLFFTRNIAKASNNFFFIYSGSAYFKQLRKPKRAPEQLNLFADPFFDPCTVRSDAKAWKGTIVGIDIAAEGGEDFSRLLAEIRKAYSLDVKHKNKDLYKRPRFI